MARISIIKAEEPRRSPSPLAPSSIPKVSRITQSTPPFNSWVDQAASQLTLTRPAGGFRQLWGSVVLGGRPSCSLGP
ncbi:hypothetical protein PRUPE_1G290300 [Prunus persica]|uniref:Uncharacterized protein n=1 Tax=Prunus persica TaxID=3760 RepID=A0A251R7L1_PRUPE|nr:hypothetical protein PRUPE_1G290300 [Prunus persica]